MVNKKYFGGEKMGRPKKDEESIYLAARIPYKDDCYEFIKSKLEKEKVSKTDLIAKAIRLLKDFESGELYAKFLPKALEELKLSVVDLNNVNLNNVHKQTKQIEPVEKAVVAPVKVEEKQTSSSFPNIEIQKQEEQEKDSLDDYTDEELEDFLKMLKR